MVGRILYDNRFSDGTPAASTTATGFAVGNLTDWRDYTQWQPTALPATVTVDTGSAKAADFWTLWGHDLGTQGATVELRGSTDNFSASDVLVDSVTPTDDDPIVRYFASASYRYWRLRVTGSTMPSIGILAAGARLVLPQGFQTGFDPYGRAPRGQFNRSVSGQPLGRSIAFQEWRSTISVPLVEWSWLRSTFGPAWDAHLKGTPFVLDWDPDNHADEAKLVWASGDFRSPHRPGERADLTFEVSGLF